MSIRFSGAKRLFSSILLSAGAAFLPTCAAVASTDAGYGEITAIELYEGHTGILVQTSHTMIDPDGCGRTDHYIVPDTRSHYDKIYALLLTAYSSHQQVRFVLDGCLQGLPAVRHVYMKPN